MARHHCHRAACAIPRDPATLSTPAGASRESPRPSLATCASRAADPDPVAGPDGRTRHRPLCLFAGAAGHARCAWLVLLRRRLHEYDQCRRLSRRCVDDVENHRPLRASRHRALGNPGERDLAGAMCAVRQFFHFELCAAARRTGRRCRLRGWCRAGANIAQSQPARANFLLSLFYAGPGSASCPRAGRTLRAAGFRAGIVVDRVVGDDACSQSP